MNSVYLCGFMGCGKSYLGRILANSLKMNLVDLDTYIVKNEGMTIPEIFGRYGEGHFRQLEAEYIKKLADNYVVSTGGGAIINSKTAGFGRENGTVIFINTSFETCYKRISGDRNRPLVMTNTKAQLKELYDEREPIYKAHSHFMINGNGSTKSMIYEMIKLVKYGQRKDN